MGACSPLAATEGSRRGTFVSPECMIGCEKPIDLQRPPYAFPGTMQLPDSLPLPSLFSHVRTPISSRGLDQHLKQRIASETRLTSCRILQSVTNDVLTLIGREDRRGTCHIEALLSVMPPLACHSCTCPVGHIPSSILSGPDRQAAVLPFLYSITSRSAHDVRQVQPYRRASHPLLAYSDIRKCTQAVWADETQPSPTSKITAAYGSMSNSPPSSSNHPTPFSSFLPPSPGTLHLSFSAHQFNTTNNLLPLILLVL